MPFLNKVVIVTGAGSGIGEKTAIHFAKLSARLSLVDIDGINLKRVTEVCEKQSRAKILKLTADLAVEESVKKVIDDTYNQYGRIDVIVNCAGIYLADTSILDENIMNTYDKLAAVNLRSIAAMTHYATKALKESKGNIINLSSVAAVVALQSSMYAVLKASLSHFTRCVALELAEHGVRVNAVLPGIVSTNIFINGGTPKEISDDFMRKGELNFPQKRVLKPEEIAEIIAFLASEKAASITGVNYLIDGGLTLDPSKLLDVQHLVYTGAK